MCKNHIIFPICNFNLNTILFLRGNFRNIAKIKLNTVTMVIVYLMEAFEEYLSLTFSK